MPTLSLILVVSLVATTASESVWRNRRKDPAMMNASAPYTWEIATIASFNDIDGFLLYQMQNALGMRVGNITYVRNANEIHQYIETGIIDLGFMSYDDTLSIALTDNFTGNSAAYPVHGGILSLCGKLDVYANKTRVGIDTDTGYARALRAYLHSVYPNPSDYNKLQWVYAGATNIRAERLSAGAIDATLLNPYFSTEYNTSHPGECVSIANVTGPYQGIVANVNKKWLEDPVNKLGFANWTKTYHKMITNMVAHPNDTIAELATFYNISQALATGTYDALFGSTGLDTSLVFDTQALAGTEKLFSDDTGIKVPTNRWWVIPEARKHKGSHRRHRIRS